MTKNGFSDFFIKMSVLDRFLLFVLIIGSVMLSIGVFKGIVEDSQVQVEVIESDKNISKEIITVDISGEVMFPGVYELPLNSRIKDGLVRAGGLSSYADREYVQKVLNLAEFMKDGQKLFIPKVISKEPGVGYIEANSGTKLININSASVEELDTLMGIGVTRANEIIIGRPYKDINELVSKGVLSVSVVDKIKDKISVY